MLSENGVCISTEGLRVKRSNTIMMQERKVTKNGIEELLRLMNKLFDSQRTQDIIKEY